MTVKVKPLVWAKNPVAEIWRCDSMLGAYKVFGVGATPSWDFDDHFGSVQISTVTDTIEAAKAAAQADYEARILAALEPDQTALALVAAAYRDAADAVPVDQYPGSWITPMFSAARDRIIARTPADAEAHLTALLRAEYERGVREAADVADDLDPDIWHYSTGNRARYGQSPTATAILALLTQEGR